MDDWNLMCANIDLGTLEENLNKMLGIFKYLFDRSNVS